MEEADRNEVDQRRELVARKPGGILRMKGNLNLTALAWESMRAVFA